MGSVKGFKINEPASDSSMGTGRFVFSDDYSVFDWGKMPDQIHDKGKALCTMGAFNFERLEAEGIPTHYRGVVEDGAVKSLDETDGAVDTMAIQLTQAPELPFVDGSYDYDAFLGEGGENYLIPLEIVFRNAVPRGSSLRRRRSPREVGLDVDEWPEESVRLDEPIIEFSTKYEEQDVYLKQDRAREISGLDDQFDELEQIAREVNRVITEQAESQDLSHEDGKIECLYFRGEIQVADVIGTFDENRFLYDGEQISKEFLRQYYKGYDPEWVEAVSESKEKANQQQIADWRSLCEREPEPLPEEIIRVASDLYLSGTNLYTARSFFDAPPLNDVLGDVQAVRAG